MEKAGDAKALLKEARDAYLKSHDELKRSLEKQDIMLLRDTYEKGWLAIIKATDALLEGKGLGKSESYKDRRDKLWELSRKDETVKELGLHDRFGAREVVLHVHGFYDGIVGWELADEELEKVEKYLRDIEKLLSS
ncbi:MAG: hypothetical protein ACUVTD_01765 [Nitrososphaerales archaeon]